MERQAGSADSEAVVAEGPKVLTPRRSALYLFSAFAMTAIGLGAVFEANRNYAPEMYRPEYMTRVADAFADGKNFAVFDLNINIRKLRDEQWQRLDRKPGVLILGASQWQEASADLMPGHDYLNGHVHRDYYEDVVGMVGRLVRHDKLPRDLVITIRDRLFTPVAERTDYLWLPGILYYQEMARHLSLPELTFLETSPLQRPRELISLAMLFSNATRWHKAVERPQPTSVQRHPTLDLLHPDGSITWSGTHLELFTQRRSRKVSLEHAESNRKHPPAIDPKGVEAIDRLLAYLALRGVRVHLVHPPFNPIYFDHVQGSPYMAGLAEVEAVTRKLAARHKLNVVGGFDPAILGCKAEMFIDAEHSNANCLRRLLAQIAQSVESQEPHPARELPLEIAGREPGALRALAATPVSPLALDAAESPVPATTPPVASVEVNEARHSEPVLREDAPRPPVKKALADAGPDKRKPAQEHDVIRRPAPARAPVSGPRPPVTPKAAAHRSANALQKAPARAGAASRNTPLRAAASSKRAVKKAPARQPVAARPLRQEPIHRTSNLPPQLVWPGDSPVRSR